MGTAWLASCPAHGHWGSLGPRHQHYKVDNWPPSPGPLVRESHPALDGRIRLLWGRGPAVCGCGWAPERGPGGPALVWGGSCGVRVGTSTGRLASCFLLVWAPPSQVRRSHPTLSLVSPEMGPELLGQHGAYSLSHRTLSWPGWRRLKQEGRHPWEFTLLLWGVSNGVRRTWVQIPALLRLGCVVLGNWLSLSEFQFMFKTGNLISTS